MSTKKEERQYFYAEGRCQFGPYSYDELIAKPLRNNTLVWFEGLDSWTQADRIEELSPFFHHAVPPPLEGGDGVTVAFPPKLPRDDFDVRRRWTSAVIISFAVLIVASLFLIILILKQNKPYIPMPLQNFPDSVAHPAAIILNTAKAKPTISLVSAGNVKSTTATVEANVIPGTEAILSETAEYAVKGTKKFWKCDMVRKKGKGVAYVKNLKPSTTYSYRIRVKSKAGTVLSDLNTFTTLPPTVDVVYTLSQHDKTWFEWCKTCNLSGKNRRLISACDYDKEIVRNKAVSIAGSTPGSFNIGQICDLFDFCYKNWKYVSDAQRRDRVELASNTLSNGLNGDCDDFAVLIASMVIAVGGEARISYVYNGDSGHAYAEVNIGTNAQTDVVAVEKYVAERYSKQYKGNTWYRTDEQGNHWLNLDWWESHPGGRYYQADDGIRFYILQKYCEEY